MNIRKNIQGFTLIETLVALIVLSIGMLGIAALHVESLKASQTAFLRSKAINFATDMADRIRANPAAPANNFTLAGVNRNCGNRALDANPANDCTPTEVAEEDIWAWENMVQNVFPAAITNPVQVGLPGASTTLIVDPSTVPDTIVIRVDWTDKEENYFYELAVAR